MRIPQLILLQHYFGNMWPLYLVEDRDKPLNWTVDPDEGNKDNKIYILKDILICFLNEQGYKSIVCQTSLTFE